MAMTILEIEEEKYDNIQASKRLMNLVDELRHLDGIKGGMAVSEKECMATTVLKEATPLTRVIYSDSSERPELF
jgi:two-component system sensor histidine kinase VicK